MTSQQLTSKTQQLESRVEALERELEQLRTMLSSSLSKEEPWWVKIAGSAKDDPTFDEAMRLGRDWRDSAES